ncbi:MAG: 1-acyl-sn-glycerol-3-phosphate acyltransferase [Thermodesulfobacteriota bacterium]
MKGSASPSTVPDFLKDPRYALVDGALTEETPRSLRNLIRILSANVTVSEQAVDLIRRLAADGPIVYAMKYRSIYDLHFLRTRFAELGGLPLPAFAFAWPGIAGGSVVRMARIWADRIRKAAAREQVPPAYDHEAIRSIAEQGGGLVMHLVDEETFTDRYVNPSFDPLQIILDMQGQARGCVSIVPVHVLYDPSARQAIRPIWEVLLGDFDRPGLLRRIQSRIRQWAVPELLVGEPVRLLEEMEEFGSDESWEDLPFEVRKKLVSSINARIRVTRGPEVLSRTEIEERVLRDPRVQASVSELVSSSGFSVEKARAKAQAYLREIAAVQHGQSHHVLYHLLKWTFSSLFDGLDFRSTDFVALKEANARYSLVFVPCHKSHFDYLLLGFLCFINQLMIPYIAAGTNLSFWPVGFIFRNSGAFFIRRSFQGQRLYSNVFNAYLNVLVREKINIKFYIEGGRSRTGKLLQARLGMLSFLLQTVEDGTVEDLYFVPVHVGYDQVPEENSYLRELSGREKKKESLGEMLRLRKVFRRRYGKVYIRFHEPISFRRFCNQRGVDAIDGLDSRERKALHNAFADHLVHGIVRKGVVTSTELLAAAVTCLGTPRISQTALHEAVRVLSVALERGGIELSEKARTPETAIDAGMRIFRDREFVAVEPAGAESGEVFYVPNPHSRPNMVFYRNGLVNYLWPASILATLLLARPEATPCRVSPELKEEFGFLVGLLVKEIIMDPFLTWESRLEQAAGVFADQGWMGKMDEKPESGTWPPAILRGVVADLLETYYFMMVAAERTEEGTRTALPAVVKIALSAAQTSYREREADSVAPAISSLVAAAALTRLTELGVLEYRSSRKTLVKVSDQEKLRGLRERMGRILGYEAQRP